MRRLGIAADLVPFDDICGRLPTLLTLSLPDNFWFAGDISGVVTCTRLQHLILRNNSFYGVVPDLSLLTRLRTLDISWNSFSGVFPWASLTAMPGLEALVLGDNPYFERTDPFPNEITRLSNLTVLYLPVASIGGVIPPGIGDMENLVYLDLSINFLTGNIPPEITRLTKLQQFDMHYNSLCGHRPTGFGKLTKLQYFAASMNNLTGSLSELRSLTLKLQRGRVGAPLHLNLRTVPVNTRIRVDPAPANCPTLMTRGAPRVDPASAVVLTGSRLN